MPELREKYKLEYSERLVCFIDLLGFKGAIDKSKTDMHVLCFLYAALSALEGQNMADLMHGGIPVLSSDGFSTADKKGMLESFRRTWPLTVTQFSDSFVISCPAENPGSCRLLVQAVDKLQHLFFKSMGMLMRGGVSKGQLIHEQGGPLFGPAMNKAYFLESKAAIYPRVIFDESSAKHVSSEEISPLPTFVAFDGFLAFDLISSLEFGGKNGFKQDLVEFKGLLNSVEIEARKIAPSAVPKIMYLQDRLERHRREIIFAGK